MEFPKLYEPGQLNLLFNKREFFICISQGIFTSLALFFVPYAVLSWATQSSGEPLADYQTFAVTTATALVIVVSVQVRGTWAELCVCVFTLCVCVFTCAVTACGSESRWVAYRFDLIS